MAFATHLLRCTVATIALAAALQVASVHGAACVANTVPPYVARHATAATGFAAEVAQYKGAGYSLKVANFYWRAGKLVYASIWQKLPIAPPTWTVSYGLTSAQYQAEFSSKVAAGYSLVWVNGYRGTSGVPNFVAKFEKVSRNFFAFHDLTAATLSAKVTAMASQGYRATWISGYGTASALFAAVFVKGPEAWALWVDMSAAGYQTKFDAETAAGRRLQVVNTYVISGTTRYAAVFSAVGSGGYKARHAIVSASNYQCEFDNQATSGWVLQHVSGCDSDTYAAIWSLNPAWSPSDLNAIESRVNAYMSAAGLSAASFALSVGGRLVYAKGFGSYQVGAASVPVCSNTRFRIASMSKTVTSAAIFKLVQAGFFSLSSKVFGPGSIFGNTYGVVTAGSNLNLITVQHLLEHTAGGKLWNNIGDDGSSDPMFDAAWTALSQPALISAVIAARPPTITPGTKYSYSNFGYLVLGRIVEKYGGTGYGAWVRTNILASCGVSGMDIAGDTLAARKSNEVTYVGAGVYGMKVARMDAHGGWIASAADYVRFETCVDGYTSRPDVITAASVATMTTKTTAVDVFDGSSPNYAKGIAVNSVAWWHSGSLPGTTSEFVIRKDSGVTEAQFTWTILTNVRDNSNLQDPLGWDITNHLTGPFPCAGV